MSCSWTWMEAAGRILYGERWKSPLARAMGIDRKTVERWMPEASQHAPISRSHYLHVRHLLAMHEAGVPIEVE